MATTASRFYPHTDDWDGTDPAGGDVRKLLETLPAEVATTAADFGTSGTKKISLDPYSTNSSAAAPSGKWGWAINLTGADGMGSTATAKRFIKAGTWFCQGSLSASPAASLSAVTVYMRIYLVRANNSRNLISEDSVSAGIVTAAGVNWSMTTASIPEIELDAGETIQVSHSLECTGQIGGLVITMPTGDSALLNDRWIDVPSPGVRTIYIEDIAVSAVGTAAVTVGTKTITGVVYDSAGVPVNGATTKLFRQSDDVKISTRTTGADGVYRFTRADDDTDLWYVVGFSDATHHATTDRDLTAS